VYPLPLFHFAGYPISLYTLFYGLGFVPAVALALWLARERGHPLRAFVDGAALTVVAALLGGPLIVFMLRIWSPTLPLNWSFAQIAAVLIALGIYNRLRGDERIPFWESLDTLAPPMALYIAVARVGCFANGCCHGTPAWDLPWAVTFGPYASDMIYQGIPVHPTQLYEAAGCLAIFGLLMALRNRPAWHGRLAWAFLAAYGTIRFVIEFYRGDLKPQLGPLSLAQWMCVGMVALGGGLLLYGRRTR
jgi:phosphatidylglycerol:prolipoprotein diacylglycerol transferase